MSFFRNLLPIALVASALLFPSSPLLAQLPVSSQAKLIETVSPAEVLIQATGIYRSEQSSKGKARREIERHGTERAGLDARRAAVNFLLSGGTDPMLHTAEEKRKFKTIATSFFAEENISQYISFEEQRVLRSVKIDDGTGIKVTKRFKINKKMIQEYLAVQGIVKSRTELAEAVGLPFIAVLPEVQKGQNPIALLRSSQVFRHGATVLEKYLTAREFDVLVPEQQEQLKQFGDAQKMLAGGEEDYAYQLALAIGSDVYITFGGAEEDAGYGTRKYAAQVRAYETTTARLLGTETGYSQGRKGELMVSVEEALNDAIDKVLSRITNYWKEDLRRGIQYKLLVELDEGLDEYERDEVQLGIMDAIDAISLHSKENVLTDRTMDYLLWCTPELYVRSSQVYRDLRREFADTYSGVQLRRVILNRKMLMLKAEIE